MFPLHNYICCVTFIYISLLAHFWMLVHVIVASNRAPYNHRISCSAFSPEIHSLLIPQDVFSCNKVLSIHSILIKNKGFFQNALVKDHYIKPNWVLGCWSSKLLHRKAPCVDFTMIIIYLMCKKKQKTKKNYNKVDTLMIVISRVIIFNNMHECVASNVFGDFPFDLFWGITYK